MNRYIYFLFLVIFLFNYLGRKLHVISHYLTWTPELFSVLTILIISARFIFGGGKYFSPKYVIWLFLFFLNIVIGIMVNLEPAGPIIAGLRAYLRYLPFFILPFVYPFSKEQIQGQLKFLLFLFLIQTPISLYQRLVQSRDLLTGDLVTGTFTGSGHLTVALCCAVAVLMSFYLAKKISFNAFVALFLLLFLPMTINETKVTVVLLPIALSLPIFFSPAKINIKQFSLILGMGTLTAFAFVFVYDYFMQERWGYGLIDFLTMEGRTEDYLYKGTEDPDSPKGMGKLDTFIVAFQTLSGNILNLLFGLGISNVSEYLSMPQLSGEYAEKYIEFNVSSTSLALTLWELGLSGALLYYTFFFMVFKDARRLSHLHKEAFTSVLAGGWSVVVVLITIATTYNNVLHETATAYLFWYFSGYVVSEYIRYRKTNYRLLQSNPIFEEPLKVA